MKTKNSSDYVNSLARGLTVLDLLGREGIELTLSQVAKQLNLDRATARRSLLTLKELGYVCSADARRFQLTAKVLALGSAYLSSNSYWRDVQPILRRVRDSTGESVLVGILDGTEFLCTAAAKSRNLVGIELSVGSRLPAHCTSIGQVLLSGCSDDELDRYFSNVDLTRYTSRTITTPDALRESLANVRRLGYCLSDEELELGLIAIAVPISSRSGRLLAAMGCPSLPNRVSRIDMRRRFVPVLRKAAIEVAEFLPECLSIR